MTFTGGPWWGDRDDAERNRSDVFSTEWKAESRLIDCNEYLRAEAIEVAEAYEDRQARIKDARETVWTARFL